MHDFYILCVKPRIKFPIFSWLIRLFQGNLDYSHMAVQVGCFVVDITKEGVHKHSISEYANKYKLVRKYRLRTPAGFPINLDQWIDLVDEAPYAMEQNFGLLLNWLNILTNNPWGEERRRLICAELCLVFMFDHGMLPVLDTDEYDLEETEEIVKHLSLPL